MGDGGTADVDLDAAEDFIVRHARLVDRLLFAHRFRGGSAESVVHALRAYQNDDGGFGHALEPDVRGPQSEPIHADSALRVLHAAGVAPPELVARLCSYLLSVTPEDSGVAAISAEVLRWPRGEHWQPAVWTADALNPTAMITGLLHGLHVGHAWLERADAFCWRRLGEVDRIEDGPALSAVYCFLNHAPDRRRAVQVAEDLADSILTASFFALDPEDLKPGEYAHTPLDLAPSPHSMAAGLFAPELLAAHLDHLAAEQQDDGGWPITWEPPTEAAVHEWRGRWTLESLLTLQRYGRITEGVVHD